MNWIRTPRETWNPLWRMVVSLSIVLALCAVAIVATLTVSRMMSGD